MKREKIMNHLCPVCGDPKKGYNPNIKSYRWRKTCGKRNCITQSTKNTNIENYGHVSNLHAKAENGKSILRNSIEQKYGVTNISQLDHVKLKKQETCLANFGVNWPMQSEAVRQKSVDTVMTNYGHTNISKVPEIIEKIKDTHVSRYGNYYMATAEGKERLQATCQEKYGKNSYFSTEEFKEKLEKRCMELFGVPNPFMSAEVQKNISKKHAGKVSKEETKWLDSLNILNENRQVHIKTLSGNDYIVDGYDPETNTVYEYNGSFWHGNPECYDQDKYHPKIKNMTFGDLYNNTLIREEDLIRSGYNVVAKWS